MSDTFKPGRQIRNAADALKAIKPNGNVSVIQVRGYDNANYFHGLLSDYASENDPNLCWIINPRFDDDPNSVELSADNNNHMFSILFEVKDHDSVKRKVEALQKEAAERSR